MNDSTLLTVCGIAAIGGVAVMLAALLVLRLLRFSLFGFANLIVKMFAEPREDPDVASIQAHAAPVSADDLRAKAEQLDFDAAVERARREHHDEPSALLEPPPYVPDPPDADFPRQRGDHAAPGGV